MTHPSWHAFIVDVLARRPEGRASSPLYCVCWFQWDQWPVFRSVTWECARGDVLCPSAFPCQSTLPRVLPWTSRPFAIRPWSLARLTGVCLGSSLPVRPCLEYCHGCRGHLASVLGRSPVWLFLPWQFPTRPPLPGLCHGRRCPLPSVRPHFARLAGPALAVPYQTALALDVEAIRLSAFPYRFPLG